MISIRSVFAKRFNMKDLVLAWCLLAIVGLTIAAENTWKTDTEYVYNVYGRSLVGLHQVRDQYVGTVMKAKLSIRRKSGTVLSAKISEVQTASVHKYMENGWKTNLADAELKYQPLRLTCENFEIKLKNNVITGLRAEKQIPNWEANLVKGFLSQIQVDTQRENVIESRNNQLPRDGSDSATYKTMEETVSGKYETLYEVSRLPDYITQMQPQWIPLPHLRGKDHILEIVKTKNFSSGANRVGYHFGLDELKDWKLSGMNNFFTRSSISHIYLSGSLKRYTIQCSGTIQEVIISPTLYNSQKGIMVTNVTLCLQAVKSASGKPVELSQPQNLGSLVYHYDRPFPGSQAGQPASRRTNENPSESSEESSEESDALLHPRNPRSLDVIDSEYTQAKPTLQNPPDVPFLPFFVGNQGQSIKEDKSIDIVSSVQKMCMQLSQDLQNPSDIPKQSSLEKYTVLADLVRIMSYEELETANGQIYSYKQKSEESQVQIWNVFRDAVAQSGTPAALGIISNWIRNDQISAEEAAQVLSVLPESASTPTDEYMRTLYMLVTSQKVQSTASLNETAILSFTELVRKVYVSNEVSHSKYPVHAFGQFNSAQHTQVVENEYIPFMEKCLKDAVEQRDDHKILVWARAIGNIAHPKILSIFEPYLEGKVQVSQFQRLYMVISLHELVECFPDEARPVLYNIYQNRGESSEIRSAAVFQIMRSSPPATMLQRMAEYTNLDEDNQVNSAVKSAIESATQLEGNDYAELRESARAAVNLLSPKIYGHQYSKSHLMNYVVQEMNLKYKQYISHITGAESIIPKALMYSLRANMGGVNRQFMSLVSVVSSVDELTENLKDQVYDEEVKEQAKNSPWSSENIWKALNMNSMSQQQREHLQGVLSVTINNMHRFLTYNNESVECVFRDLDQYVKLFRSGKRFNFTQLVSTNDMVVAFPTELGMPFVYSLQNPSLVSFAGEASLKINPDLKHKDGKVLAPDSVQLTSSIKTIISRKVQAKISFVTPFDHQQYIAGFDHNTQLNIPLRSDINIDLKNTQVRAHFEFLEKDKDFNIFHYSSWPYTVQCNILDLQPVNKAPSFQLIKVRRSINLQKTFGRKAGLAIQVRFSSQQEFADLLWLYRQTEIHKFPFTMMAPWFHESIHHTSFDIDYIAKYSTSRGVNIAMGITKQYQSSSQNELNESNSGIDISSFSSLSRDSLERQQQLLQKVRSQICSCSSYVCDASVEFVSPQKLTYSATSAFARSNVDKKSRFLFFYRKSSDSQEIRPYEIALGAQFSVPNTDALDFTYALNFDPTTTYEIQLALGENYQSATKLSAKGKLYKSEEYKQYLQQLPLTKEYAKDLQEGNYQIGAGRNLTTRANFLDSHDLQIKFSKSWERNSWTTLLAGATSHVLYLGFQNSPIEKRGKQNELNVHIQHAPDFRSFNLTYVGEDTAMCYEDVRVNSYFRNMISAHPVHRVDVRLLGEFLGYNYRPTCVVDATAMETFDGKSFPIQLENNWYAAMLYAPENSYRSSNNENYVVLTRQAGKDQREVKVTFYSKNTYYEVEMKPTPSQSRSSSGSQPLVEVYVNKQKQQFSDQFSADIENGLLKSYALPNGEVKVEFQGDFYLVCDGKRFKLVITNYLRMRSNVRGLCGNFNGEQEDEFVTPKGAIVQLPQEYVASYAIINQESSQKLQQLAAKANKHPAYSKQVMYSDVVNSRNPQQNENANRHGARDNCNRNQIQYAFDKNGNLCFTVRPIPVCSKPCKPAKNVQRNINVHCVKRSNAAELWKTQIDKGVNPTFTPKEPTHTMKMKIPENCYMP